MCIASFDEFGVDGVYKVMKAERLSRVKSLTEGVTLNLTKFATKVRWVYRSVRWAFSSCHW
jgi:hypothetical protein